MSSACFALSFWTFLGGQYDLAINDRTSARTMLKLLKLSIKALDSPMLELMVDRTRHLEMALNNTGPSPIEDKKVEIKPKPPAKKNKKKQEPPAPPKPEVSDLEKEIESAQKTNAELQKQVADLKKQAIQSPADINGSLLNEQARLEQEQVQLEQQSKEVESSKAAKIKEFEGTIAKLTQDKAALQEGNKVLNAELQRQKKEEQEATQKTERLQKTLKGLQEDNGKLESLLMNLEQSISAKQKTLQTLQTPVVVQPSAEGNRLAENASEKRNLEEAIKKLEIENQQIAKQCNDFQAKMVALREHIDNMKIIDQKQRQNYLAHAQATLAHLCATQMAAPVAHQYRGLPALTGPSVASLPSDSQEPPAHNVFRKKKK
jgi:DNA repair exonuclease SbcCD ATPase subunit